MSKELVNRILDISREHGLSHVGSCVSAVGIIDGIYEGKQSEDKFVLSQGHAGLALYTVLEKHEGRDAVRLMKKHGTHPDAREDGIHCATGSLGLGLSVALGMALADRDRDVYCLISDGECAEGIVYESLRIKDEQNVDNLKVHVNANGWSALGRVNIGLLEHRLKAFDVDVVVHRTVSDVENLKGLAAHYDKLL